MVATAVIPVVMATAALAGRAATADRTVGIVGHVRGDGGVGPAVADGCSSGTAVGAGDGGMIGTAVVAGDGGMVRTDCHTAVGAGDVWLVGTALGAGDGSMRVVAP